MGVVANTLLLIFKQMYKNFFLKSTWLGYFLFVNTCGTEFCTFKCWTWEWRKSFYLWTTLLSRYTSFFKMHWLKLYHITFGLISVFFTKFEIKLFLFSNKTCALSSMLLRFHKLLKFYDQVLNWCQRDYFNFRERETFTTCYTCML